MAGTIPKPATKVILFFDMTKYFCKKIQYKCIFLHPRIYQPRNVPRNTCPEPRNSSSPCGVQAPAASPAYAARPARRM